MGLPLPEYASPGAAGMDLLAAVTGPLTLPAHGALAVPTGIALALVDGYEAQIRPRSGLALNANIGVINSPGTVDSDYRGEIKVILSNFSDTPYIIHRGDRIAQMVIARYEKVKWEQVDELPASGRGAGGFGHSGK
jgi:dUTP pyrophosphatase